MELLLRILNKSFDLAKKKPVWLIFAFMQSVAVVLYGLSMKYFFFNTINAWMLFLPATILISFSVALLWPKIKNFYEQKERQIFTSELLEQKKQREIWLRTFILCIIFAMTLLVFRFLVWNWPHAIFFASIISSFFLGALLFMVIYELSIKDSLKGSVDLWLKKTQFPVLISFCLMIGNGFALVASKTLYFSLQTGGFPEIFPFAKIWSLALVLLVIFLFLTVWFNCLMVVGFMELIKPSRKILKDEMSEKVLEPRLIE